MPFSIGCWPFLLIFRTFDHILEGSASETPFPLNHRPPSLSAPPGGILGGQKLPLHCCPTIDPLKNILAYLQVMKISSQVLFWKPGIEPTTKESKWRIQPCPPLSASCFGHGSVVHICAVCFFPSYSVPWICVSTFCRGRSLHPWGFTLGLCIWRCMSSSCALLQAHEHFRIPQKTCWDFDWSALNLQICRSI